MPKTVRVRIAVAVDVRGAFNACGGSYIDDIDAIELASEVLSDPNLVHWVGADLPVPEEIEVAGEVEETGADA